MEEEIKYSEMEEVKQKFALLKGQKAPCAVFIGFNTVMDSGIRKVDNGNYDEIAETVQRLRQNGIDAVPAFSEQAADPSKTVVTAGGIQTPVLKPEKLEEAAMQIFEALNPMEIREEPRGSYRGYNSEQFVACAPVEFDNLAPVAPISTNIYSKTFETGLTHPNTEEYVQLREKFGFDLEYDLLKEAEGKELLSAEQIKAKNADELKYVYRGGCLGDNPHTVFAARETKYFAYVTPDVECAKMYSGLDDYGYGVHLRAASSKAEETKQYGLVYEMEAASETGLYEDWSLEQGHKPRKFGPSKEIKSADWEGRNMETSATPTVNKMKGVYLHIKKGDKDMFYPIPLKDKRWQAFLALHRSSDTCLRGFMIERRQRVLAERKVYGSLNNEKVLGLFKKKVKPFDFGAVDREKALKEANLTIEEKRAAQTKSADAKQQEAKKTAARIKELRCSKAKTINMNPQVKKREVSHSVLKFVSENKKTADL